MVECAADRNLLFGILAMQMDLVTRDALVVAMNAWVLDKQRTLGEILVAQGALCPDDRALLEPVIERHIQIHGGDPAQSLSAVGSADSAREAMKPIDDDDLQASLGHLGTQPDDGTDPDRTATYDHAPASSGGRFRIIRLHDRGGLGEVFVASDEELHREVALKQIRSNQADNPDSRARFVVEAEITGGLEHPGIVPVYSLGQDEAGRPFYAMRFIKGESLKEAARRYHEAQGPRRDPVGFRRLLAQLLDVCNAIAYAHSRGVLHRDLKPGNIVLGKYGETIVVDWGLAKPLGHGDSSLAEEATLKPSAGSGVDGTVPGRALGTPGYMSPEQAAGRLDQLSPRSDVYSLGATLYHVLTGRAPFSDADWEERLRRNQSGNFTPLRKISPRVPGTLEVICHRAMALRPEDRYPTVRALADDLEKWLADEPVPGESFATRAGRWRRKHPAVASWLFAMIFVDIQILTWAMLSELSGYKHSFYEIYVAGIFYLGMVFQFWLFMWFAFSFVDIGFIWAGTGGSLRKICRRKARGDLRLTVMINWIILIFMFTIVLMAYFGSQSGGD